MTQPAPAYRCPECGGRNRCESEFSSQVEFAPDSGHDAFSLCIWCGSIWRVHLRGGESVEAEPATAEERGALLADETFAGFHALVMLKKAARDVHRPHEGN